MFGKLANERIGLLTVVVLLLVLAILACGINASPLQAAQEKSNNGAPTPEATVTPKSTETISDCTLGAVFQTDVTVPDNARIEAGQSFVKTWRIRNTGTCDWGAGYYLTFVDGDQMMGPRAIAVPDTLAGEDAEISVELVAPMEEGRYQGYWQICKDRTQCFGDRVYVQVVSAMLTATPEPTVAISDCTLGAVFQTDVTVPDNARIEAGQSFVKTWRIRNTGTCDWGAGYYLTFVDGNQIGGPSVVNVPETPAGGVVEISVRLVAPMEEGRYQGYWQICKDRTQCFGDKVYVQIVSVGQAVTPKSPVGTGEVEPINRYDASDSLASILALITSLWPVWFFFLVLFIRYKRSSKVWTSVPKYSQTEARVYTISVPKGVSWNSKRAYRMIEHLLTFFGGHLDFRILVEPGRVLWQIVDPRGFVSDLESGKKAIQVLYPEADVTVSEYRQPEMTKPFLRVIALPKLQFDYYAPLLSVSEVKEVDPLASLVQAMSGLREGERLTYTLHVWGPIDKYTWRQTVKKTQISGKRKAAHFGLGLLAAMLSKGQSTYAPLIGTGATGKGRYISEEQKLFEHKLYSPLFNVHLLVEADWVGEEDTDRIDNLFAVIGNQFGTEYNRWALAERVGDSLHVRSVEAPDTEKDFSAMGFIVRLSQKPNAFWKRSRGILSIEEMSAMWHLPHDGFATTEVVWAPTRRVAPADLVKNEEGVLIGHNVFGGYKYPIRLPDRSRETHLSIVGKTGVGKSTLMHNLIHRDLKDGKGVGVVDPHGKLVSDILRYSIPDDRIDDVVVIDIANEEHPPPLNPLVISGASSGLAAGQLIAVLDKIYGGIQNTPRIADTITAALVTLWQERAPTVRDVVRLFTDIEYRRRLLDGLDDVITLEYWEKFEDLSPSMQDNLSYPVIHRMRKFYGNPVLYPMMCHPDAFGFAELISGKKIVLVSLAAEEEKVPEPEQQLLGAVLVSQLQMAGMKSWDGETSFYLYIDEVQNFVTTALDKVLEGARKYGFHLTVANQYLGQLRGKTLDSVMGTVGATAVFQIGLNDAKLLAPYLHPEFDVGDLVNLPLYQAAVKVRFKGKSQPAFSIETLPPPENEESDEAVERERMIRQRSIERYTPKTREDVLEWLEKRYPGARFGKGKGGDVPDNDGWIVPED